MAEMKSEQDVGQRFVEYLTASSSAFHCVASSVKKLNEAGFQYITESNPKHWENLQPGGKYYFTRNQSSLVAFAIGGKWSKGAGFNIMAAHTDSPVFKIKPRSQRNSAGYQTIGIAPYGGGLWHTWFDRELSIAGRVIVKKSDNAYEHRLVKIDRPLLVIPNLAIHLTPRDERVKGFKPNLENECNPIFATEVKAKLRFKEAEKILSGKNEETLEAANHTPGLMSLLSEALGCDIKDICDFDLNLFDTNNPRVIGACEEFVHSARLDNQAMCFATLNAMIDSLPTLADDTTVRVIVHFDNEEIGSNTNRGAKARLVEPLLERVNGAETLDASIQKSVLISADQAHAIHPNYASKHEVNHKVAMHDGLVIKYNSQELYATTAWSAWLLNEVAKKNSIPIQRFSVRNDSPCGSTIGPHLSAKLGMRTVDVGAPQLAMHSIRELCSISDIASSTRLFTHFFNEYAALDAKLTVDESSK